MGTLTLPQTLQDIQAKRVYFDTNGLIYFFDKHPVYFSAILPFIVACDKGEFLGFAGDLTVCELMVHPYRNQNQADIERAKQFFKRKNFIQTVSHTAEIFDTTSKIRACSKLKLPDALHLATAIANQCDFLLTGDVDFSQLPPEYQINVINFREFIL